MSYYSPIKKHVLLFLTVLHGLLHVTLVVDCSDDLNISYASVGLFRTEDKYIQPLVDFSLFFFIL
jgi:hypothetical protein